MDDDRAPKPAIAMRASDADRERVAQLLHAAVADGRLSLAEVEERLTATYRARTLPELEPLTRDLGPLPGPLMQPGQFMPPSGQFPASQLPADSRPYGHQGAAPEVPSTSWAVMSHLDRRGNWMLPRRYTVGVLMGSARLDLRAATFAEQHSTIVANTVMGSVEIIVGDDIDVVIDGTGVMGTFENRAALSGGPTVGSIRVLGVALMGSVEVRRASRKERRGRLA